MALTKVSTDGVKDDAITKTKIPANQIEASELANNAVDTNAIANDAVTTAKIADSTSNTDGITTAKIATGAITTAKLATDAVDNSKLADQAVTLDKLPHGTSSNDGKFLRANNGADPTFETVTSTTINSNSDNRVITGSGTANTLNGESNLTFDGTTLGHNKGGLTNLQKVVIQGSGNSTGDNLTLNNWGNSDGDYWTLGVNMTANSGGSFAKTNTTLRCVGVNLDGRMGRIIFNAAETSSSTINDAHTFTRDGSHYMNGSLYLGGETAAANALDDYEEGEFNPTFVTSYGSISMNSSYNTLAYTKIGRMVHIMGQVVLSVSSPGGNLDLASLPFAFAQLSETSERGWALNVGYFNGSNAPSGSNHFSFQVRAGEGAGTSGVRLQGIAPNDDGSIADWCGSGTDLWFNFWYITT